MNQRAAKRRLARSRPHAEQSDERELPGYSPDQDWRSFLPAAGLFILAALSRILPFQGQILAGGRVLIRDPDACYHLRRAEIIAQNFPDLTLFDRFMNHPHGAFVIWPPLYDLLLAGLLRLFPAPGGQPGVSLPVALLPPLLFAATTVVIYALARRLWPASRFLPALAAGLIPGLFASAPYTRLGNLDHHAAEFLLTALFLLAYARSLDRLRAGTAVLRAAWLPGLALGAALLVQLTLIILIPFPAAALLLLRGERRDRVAGFAAAIPAVALLVVAPFAWLYHAAGAPLLHYQFGLFQPLLLSGAALLALAARFAFAPAGMLRRIAAPAALLLCGGMLILPLAGPLSGAAGYLFRQSRWIAHIGESRSLLAAGWGGLEDALLTASPLILLLPLALARLARQGWRGDAPRGMLFFATAGFMLLGALQARFLPHLTLLVGIAALIALEPILGPPDRRRPVRLALYPLLLLLSLWPTLPAWSHTDESELAFERSRSVLEALARDTPPTLGLRRPREQPEYGVLAEWSYGHFIQYYGERAAVADNFGDYLNDLDSVSAFFLARAESDALEVTARTKSRYILVGDLPATLSGLNLDDETLGRYVTGSNFISGKRSLVDFSPAILYTVLYRLAWRNGGGMNDPRAGYIPPLVHFRLVAESEATVAQPNGGPVVPWVKLYEIVPGATVRIHGAPPGQSGSLLVWVLSPRGVRFPLYYRLQTDRRGEALLTLPYPTAASAGSSRIAESEFSLGDWAWRLPEISEAAIAAGAEIPLTPALLRTAPGSAGRMAGASPRHPG
jgi:dolichyl-diphosphooligosaccharide--protein glycosyltransferase